MESLVWVFIGVLFLIATVSVLRAVMGSGPARPGEDEACYIVDIRGNPCEERPTLYVKTAATKLPVCARHASQLEARALRTPGNRAIIVEGGHESS